MKARMAVQALLLEQHTAGGLAHTRGSSWVCWGWQDGDADGDPGRWWCLKTPVCLKGAEPRGQQAQTPGGRLRLLGGGLLCLLGRSLLSRRLGSLLSSWRLLRLGSSLLGGGLLHLRSRGLLLGWGLGLGRGLSSLGLGGSLGSLGLGHLLVAGCLGLLGRGLLLDDLLGRALTGCLLGSRLLGSRLLGRGFLLQGLAELRDTGEWFTSGVVLRQEARCCYLQVAQAFVCLPPLVLLRGLCMVCCCVLR